MSNPRQFRGFGFFPGFFFNGKTGQHPRRNQSKNTSRAAEKEVPFAKKISRLAALGLRDGKQPFTTWTVNPMISVEKEEVSFLEKMYGDYLECLKTLKRRPVYSTTKLWYDMYVLKTTCCFFASGHFMNSTPQSFAKFFWCSTFLPRKNKYLLRSIKNPGCLIEILIFMVYENHPYIPGTRMSSSKNIPNKQAKTGALNFMSSCGPIQWQPRRVSELTSDFGLCLGGLVDTPKRENTWKLGNLKQRVYVVFPGIYPGNKGYHHHHHYHHHT